MDVISSCECPEGPDVMIDEEQNITYCFKCATTLETSAIVSETVFAEASNGRAIATGAYLAADETGARSQLGRRGGGPGSHQVTLANGQRRIESVANGMRLGTSIKEQASRFFSLALAHGSVHGRRTDYVVAACLYIACRLDEASTCMLIDFSDLLRVNVFVLGSTFLKLVRELNIGAEEKMKHTDPSIYIQRFAALLDFGEETQKVAQDAVRLIKRFERDWIVQGRRPSGICGACLFLAARMNNFRRSVDEIVRVVKIADVTVKRRLDEFGKTPSGQLSVEDFRNNWLDEEVDPPAFTQGLKRERARSKSSSALSAGTHGTPVSAPPSAKKRKIAHGGPSPDLPRVSIRADEDEEPIDPELMKDLEIALNSTTGRAVAGELEHQEALARWAVDDDQLPDPLDDLDEEELDGFILNEQERAMKERLWVLNNKEYLQTLAEKHLQGEGDQPRRRRRKSKKPAAPRDSSTPMAASAADATRQLVAKKVSRKLDYAIFENLFEDANTKDITMPSSGSDAGRSPSA